MKLARESWSEAQAFEVQIENDTSGDFVMFALPAGRWDLAMLVPNNQPEICRDKEISGKETHLSVSRLASAVRLRAEIKDDSTGLPIDGWKAYLQNADPSSSIDLLKERPVASGAAELVFTCLPPGDGWTLEIRPPRPYLSQSINLRGGQAGALVDAGPIYMLRSGSLDVMFRAAGVLPVGRLMITLVPESASRIPVASMQLQVSQAMKAHFDTLTPGDFDLGIVSEPAALERHYRVRIRSDRAEQLEIDLEPILLRGFVRTRSPDIGTVEVNAVDSHGNRAKAATYANEAYELSVWSSGSYRMTVTAPHEGVRKWQRVVIPEGEKRVTQDFDLDACTIRGLVVEEPASTPIGGASVEIAASESPLHETVELLTELDGSFNVPVLCSGPLSVTASAPGFVTSYPRTIKVHEDFAETTIELRRGKGLRGWVIDDFGRSVPEATVAWDYMGATGQMAGQVRASREGEFEIQGLDDSTHSLVAHGCGLAIGVSRTTSLDDPLTVRIGSISAPLDIAVTDADGNPAEPVNVVLDLEGVTLPFWWLQGLSSSCNARPTSEDVFAMDILPVGVTVLAFDSAGRLLGSHLRSLVADRWVIKLSDSTR